MYGINFDVVKFAEWLEDNELINELLLNGEYEPLTASDVIDWYADALEGE